MTRAVREALVEAAERIGSDGKGRDGLVGYLVRMAYKRPDNFDAMLMRMIPLNLPGADGAGAVAQEFRTAEEVRRAMRERGLPVPQSLLDGTPGVNDETARSLDGEVIRPPAPARGARERVEDFEYEDAEIVADAEANATEDPDDEDAESQPTGRRR